MHVLCDCVGVCVFALIRSNNHCQYKLLYILIIVTPLMPIVPISFNNIRYKNIIRTETAVSFDWEAAFETSNTHNTYRKVVNMHFKLCHIIISPEAKDLIAKVRGSIYSMCKIISYCYNYHVLYQLSIIVHLLSSMVL